MTLAVRALLLTPGLVLVAAASPAQAQQVGPDLIVHDAHVVTVDEAFSTAEAVAVRDGRFTAVGTDEQVLARTGPDTRVVDMRGRTILPGFQDTHLHLTRRTVRFQGQVDLTDVESIDELQQVIAAGAENAGEGAWIFGSRGWWPYEFTEGRLPNRYDLDRAAPETPVSISGPHFSIVNSRALEILGIDEETEDPPGGEIYRDSAGVPTGLLMDAASDPVRDYFPDISREEKLDGIRRMIDRMNSFGMTSYREPSGTKAREALLREVYEDGDMTIRVDWTYGVDPSLPIDSVEAVLESLGPPGEKWGGNMFRADQLAEIGIDGAEQTAMIRAGYPGRPDYHGIQRVSQEQLNAFAATAARDGWRVSVHAVGDAAVDQALEAYAYADGRSSIEGRRWAIDHAFLFWPDHYAQVRDLGVLVHAQYMHNYKLGRRILDAWERPLADMSYRFRDWVEHGIEISNGSDGPNAYPARPLLNIYGSVTRQTDWGGSLGPDQGLSREDAIRSVTINSAHTSFEEHVKGSIEPGKLADFVVLSDDILAVAARDIRDIEVLTTVLGGEVVHGSLEP